MSRPATELEMRLEQKIVELEERRKIIERERFVFYKLVKEAIEKRIDDDWLTRAKTALQKYG